MSVSKLFALLGVVLILLVACATVPITGRRSMSFIPGSTLNSMAFSQYEEFIGSANLSANQKDAAMVMRVGGRIQRAVEQYMIANNMRNKLDGYAWEFNLVDDPLVNAWAMPGGKVVVYTGLLPVAENETGLAVVMGHEIAHAIAGHGNERMSQGLIMQMGGLAINEAIKNKPEETKALFMTAFGLGAQLGILLPYSRLHESEADHLGLIFMAMAGYDPHAAVNFWQRMSASGGETPPEFLSTHPSHGTRIEDINKLMAEAMTYYQKN